MAATGYIGAVPFHSFTGWPQAMQQRFAEGERSGIDGVDYIATGNRAVDSPITIRVDASSAAAAQAYYATLFNYQRNATNVTVTLAGGLTYPNMFICGLSNFRIVTCVSGGGGVSGGLYHCEVTVTLRFL